MEQLLVIHFPIESRVDGGVLTEKMDSEDLCIVNYTAGWVIISLAIKTKQSAHRLKADF